jgi:beta-N-acetylhexosaminidase
MANNLTLDEKIGQIFCLDFRTWKEGDNDKFDITEINENVKNIISNFHIGGVILFGANCKNKRQLTKLVSDLKNCAIESGNKPLLIAIDQEGGGVERFTFDRKRFEDNEEIGKKDNHEDAAFMKGKLIGKELAEIGINCDLAPVVDVNSNPKNPVINVRSFGSNPDLVSKCGVKFMEGLRSENIISTAKHFPGHGDTSVDSHVSLPMITKNYEEIEKLELVPFKGMIDAGVDMIMTAHIEMPNIDSTRVISKNDGKEICLPATLSKVILTDVLRKKLNFKGVVVTDSLVMKSISLNFNKSEAVKMAINAGADIILMPVKINRPDKIQKFKTIVEDVKKAVESGEIDISRIDNAVENILNLKEKYNI